MDVISRLLSRTAYEEADKLYGGRDTVPIRRFKDFDNLAYQGEGSVQLDDGRQYRQYRDPTTNKTVHNCSYIIKDI